MSRGTYFSISARVRSFGYALRGLKYMLLSQPNAGIHLVAAIGVIALGSVTGLSKSEWCSTLLAITAVWVAEAMNTAVETLTDLVSPEFHPLAGKAKDLAAGAVLVTVIGAMAVGCFVFLPVLIDMLPGNFFNA
jgi:diacylglycerol kinase (ATP)